MTILNELTEITCCNVVMQAAKILSARKMSSKEADLFVLGVGWEDEDPVVLRRINLEPIDNETALAYERWLCMFDKDRKINLIDCIKWLLKGRYLAAGVNPELNLNDYDDCVTLEQVMSFVWPV
jgi:hypothetical protein